MSGERVLRSHLDDFHWTGHAMAAFTALKETMVDTPVLALPNFSIPFVLENDASGVGVEFVIRIDHKSLHNLLTQTQTLEQHQFLSKLLGFRYTIVYIPDASNQAVDALSRAQDSEALVATGQFFSQSYPTSSNIVVLKEELVQDQYAKQIIDALQNNLASWPQWKLVGKLPLF
ncbi:hypothetical protein Pint_22452 [Pistacia integerrima]|uniref:Uncharacterized protein n=1 Tax=Pistacia integerrima TaxID=434235 RepID=A0ACC0YML7_9ROSI|nr:hypothetical protein Pint_22452 [Pistacia integerrima]